MDIILIMVKVLIMKLNRENFGNYAGITYLLGDVAMIAKGVSDAWLQGRTVTLHDIYASPAMMAIGFAYLASSLLFTTMGNRTSGMVCAFACGLTGNIILFEQMITGPYVAGSVFGSGIRIFAGLYAMYAGLKRRGVIAGFKPRLRFQEFSKWLKKYPFAPTGCIDGTSDIFLISGAILSHDPVLTLITLSWFASSILIGLSAPRPD